MLFLLTLPCLVLAQTPQNDLSRGGTTDKFTFKVYRKVDKTFGYDIFKNGKLLIHQPTIPGRPGVSGFKTITDAEKVAKLVIGKMRKGIMPPTIEEKELTQLKI